jgi:hypothetical protein
MKTPTKKPARRILGFKEWLKATAQKQPVERDNRAKTASPLEKSMNRDKKEQSNSQATNPFI